MESFHDSVMEYKKQVEKGIITQAYKGLMEYIMSLRTHFKNTFPDHVVSGSIYFGYMDMTYFSFIPKSFVERKLKIAIVFIHAKCRFEVWLAGQNKQVQLKFWKRIKESGWNRYQIVPSTEHVDSIIEHTIMDTPDFGDLKKLTHRIESVTLEFISDVEKFLLAWEQRNTPGNAGD